VLPMALEMAGNGDWEVVANLPASLGAPLGLPAQDLQRDAHPPRSLRCSGFAVAPGWRRSHSAEEVLAERYARGEITVEESRERSGG
jgi:hypothetical protein